MRDTIVLIEDNKSTANLILKCLIDYKVIWVNEYSEIVDTINKHDPVVVLIDINTTGLDMRPIFDQLSECIKRRASYVVYSEKEDGSSMNNESYTNMIYHGVISIVGKLKSFQFVEAMVWRAANIAKAHRVLDEITDIYDECGDNPKKCVKLIGKKLEANKLLIKSVQY